MALFGGGDQSLNITIKAKDEATSTLDKVRLSVGDLAKGFALGEVAVHAFETGYHFLTEALSESLNEWETEAKAIAQTNAVLESTQHAAGLTTKEVVDLSNALSANTLYMDDQVLSAENLLLTFTNIGKDTFPRATQAVIDMSTALGQDLQSSATQLGKALNSPIDGLTMLNRVGIQFTDAQQKMIEGLASSGHLMEAQGLILDEINTKFANSAQSAYEASSSITKLQLNMKNLQQSIGQGLTPALNNLIGAFIDTSKQQNSFDSVGYITFQVTSKLAQGAIAAAAGFTAIGTAIIDATAQLGKFTSLSVRSAVDATTNVAQLASKYTGLSGSLKMVGIDVDKSLTNIRTSTDTTAGKADVFLTNIQHSVNDGLGSVVDFYNKLADNNKKVLDSWGDVTEGAHQVSKAGPAAYQATAVAATEAKKAIDDTAKSINDTKDALNTLKSLQDSLLGDDKSAASAYVQQEKKLSDLRKQLIDETDPAKQAELRATISKENAALVASQPSFKGNTQVSEAINRSYLTDYENQLIDIQERRLTSTRDALQQVVNLNFNKVVAGDAGVQEIIRQVVQTLDRSTTLRVAGT